MKRTYSAEQMRDAEKLANALISVNEDRRLMFRVALDAMATGAELAEKQLQQVQGDDPAA